MRCVAREPSEIATDRQTDTRWEGLTSGYEYFMWRNVAFSRQTRFMVHELWCCTKRCLQTKQNTCFFDSTSSGASVHAVRTVHEHKCKFHVVFFRVMTPRTLIAGTDLENSRVTSLHLKLRRRWWSKVTIIGVCKKFTTSCRWKYVHIEVVLWKLKCSAAVTTSITNE